MGRLECPLGLGKTVARGEDLLSVSLDQVMLHPPALKASQK